MASNVAQWESDHESGANTAFTGEGCSRRDIDTTPGTLPNRDNAIKFRELRYLVRFGNSVWRPKYFGNRGETSSFGLDVNSGHTGEAK